MKAFQLIFVFLAALSAANANVVISEIMYNPNQGSDTDIEWVEIYNTGASAVDLSGWKLDGSNFDDIIISPGGYIIVARELVDGTDDDIESFEAYYGNGDGMWSSADGDYMAVDGSFSLTDDDFIEVSSDVYADSVNYSSSWGGKDNGKSIYKINLNGENVRENWAESIFDGGTPGKNKNNNGILISLQVIGTTTEIVDVGLPDDSSKGGHQILPVANNVRQIEVSADVNSQQEVIVYAELNGNKVQMVQQGGNGTYKIFGGNLNMQFYDMARNYTINVSVTDQNKKTIYKMVDFEYLPLISSVFDADELNFGSVVSGMSSNEKAVTLKNAGNVAIDMSASATDLTNGQDVIDASSMQMKTASNYFSLSKAPVNVDLNLASGANSNKQVYFKINVPGNANPNMYYGVVSLNAIEG
ncbi:lamin tail domain-containing protein [Candidatus Woesearchaeota archaeon]|nr:lamin tail domain-containing protein [Candidatus Woesearchaeota archaeon]